MKFTIGSTYSDYRDGRDYIVFPSGKKLFLEQGYNFRTIQEFVKELNDLISPLTGQEIAG